MIADIRELEGARVRLPDDPLDALNQISVLLTRFDNASLKDAIEALQTTFRLLTRSQLNTSQAIERIRAEVPPSAEVEELIEFIGASQRGVVK